MSAIAQVEIEVVTEWLQNAAEAGVANQFEGCLRAKVEPHHNVAAEKLVRSRFRMVNPGPKIAQVARLFAVSQALIAEGVGHAQMEAANAYWVKIGPRGNVSAEKKAAGFLQRSGVVNPEQEQEVKVEAKKFNPIESGRFSIREENGKFSILLDGQDTGRFAYSLEKAEEIVARKSKSGKVAVNQPAPKAEAKAEAKPAPKVEGKKPKLAPKATPKTEVVVGAVNLEANPTVSREEKARLLRAAGFTAAEVAAVIFG